MSITRTYTRLADLVDDIRIARNRPTEEARNAAISRINCHLWPAPYNEVAAALGVTPGKSITAWVKAGNRNPKGTCVDVQKPESD